MPNYDYKCSSCGHSFEIFQKMSEEPLSICPSCGGTLKRLIGKGAGPIFKGSGFYHTDYKNASPNKNNSVKKTDDTSKSTGDIPKKDIPKKDIPKKDTPGKSTEKS